MDCLTCHAAYGTSTGHVNNTWSPAGIISWGVKYSASWNDASRTCSAVSCHGNAIWDSVSSLDCTGCHNTAYSAYHPDHSGSMAHPKHTATLNYSCDQCHYDYASRSNHINGALSIENDTVISTTIVL